MDHNPRTIYDPNEIRIDLYDPSIAYMDLYDSHCYPIATVMFDSEDIPKVRNIKWRLSESGYPMNTPKYKGSNKHFSRTVLGINTFVDHRDHNTLNCCKYNLRPITKSQNMMNSDRKGVNTTKQGKFYAYIKIHQKMINLGTYVDIEEALFARWYAETLLFKEFQYPKEKPIILPDREIQIKQYVNQKVQRV